VGAPVVIELSRAQVAQVVRDSAGAGNMSVWLSGLEEVRGALDAEPEQLENSRLSRSLLQGLLLLAAFPADGSHLGIAEISRTLGMNASTVHRYVSTLLEVGLLERDQTTRQYRLTQ
jgi:predicted transcriptional regulator